MYTDASLTAIGAALVQEDPVNKLHMVIGYWGQALSTAEQKWPINQLELLAAARGMLAFNFYLEHNHFTLITDHSALKTVLPKSIKPKNLERLV